MTRLGPLLHHLLHIYLPAASGVRAAPEASARAQDVPRGTKTVLLVEDDKAVLRKPFTRPELGHKVRSVLDESRWQGVVTLGWIAGVARIP